MTKKRRKRIIKKKIITAVIAVIMILLTAAGIKAAYEAEVFGRRQSLPSSNASESRQESSEPSETETQTETESETESKTDTEPANEPEPAEDKIIYLTFDDGPSANTPKILETLKKYDVKATFFVINAGGYNRYMKDIVRGGHAIGLHAYSHSYSKIYSSEQAYYADLEKIDALVERETGIKTKLLRFPGGGSNTVSRKYCEGIMTALASGTAQRGYTYFDWNSDSGDASGNNIPAEVLVKNSIESVERAGGAAVLLLHDSPEKSTTEQALPQIIEYFLERGYTFAALDESAPKFHHKISN